MKKYRSLFAVSSISLLFSACDKPEITSNDQSSSSADSHQTEAQEKLIADQAARIQELEDKEKQRQADRIDELEQREQELLASIAEQKRLAEEAAKVVEELPQPVIAGQPPVKAIEVPEGPLETWEPLEPIVSPGEDLPVTDIGYDFDYPTDYEYDPGYHPPLVEHIDYHAYVSYDWYQYHVVRERVCLQRETYYGIQIRAILLEILRAKIAYENHRKIKHHLRDKIWHTNFALLEKKWRKSKAREREILTLRQQLKKINADRLGFAKERDRKLREARRQPGWKELELRKKKHAESQRLDLVNAWNKEKKLRHDQRNVFLVKAKQGKAVVKSSTPGVVRINPNGSLDRNKKPHGKVDSQAQAKLREFEKQREVLAKAAAERSRRDQLRGKNDNSKTIPRGSSITKKDNQEAARIKEAEIRRNFDMKSELERLQSDRRAKEFAKNQKKAKEKAERERQERARRAKEAAAKEAREKAARESAARDKAARKRAEGERNERARRSNGPSKEAREKAAREQAAREKALKEKAERERQEQARRAREVEKRVKEAREKATREKVAREKAERERQERARRAREVEKREKAAREKAARERAERERREQARRAKEAAEKAARERAERAREEQRRRATEEAKRRKETEERSKKKEEEKRNPRGR